MKKAKIGKELVINGRIYPLWQQFVKDSKHWRDGKLEEWNMGLHDITSIQKITLKPNGSDSAFFSVIGRDFTCGFDVSHGGIVKGEIDWITFEGYMGHKWRIQKPKVSKY